MRFHLARVALALVAIAFVADAAPRASAQTHGTLVDTLQCYDRAAQQTNLLTDQLRRLCWATPSPTAPVDCYLAARAQNLTDPQSILLCRCTSSIAPATCYDTLHHATLLSDPEIIALCSPTIVYQLRANCTPVP